MHKVLFTAGLSNGETAAEEKGNYQTITGELSPWQRLQRYIADNDVEITSLSLYTRDGKRWTLPSISDRPKFHEFSKARKPDELRFFRKAAMEANSVPELQQAKPSDLHAVIEAVYYENGACGHCGGTGEHSCTECNASTIECTQCRGTGKPLTVQQMWVDEEKQNCWSLLIHAENK